MASAKTFIARLPVGITLDGHIQDYISFIVDVQSFADLSALRDDTEHFLDQFTSIANTNATGDTLSQISSGLTKIALTEDQDNGEAECDFSGLDDKKTGCASPQSKKPFKSKPVQLTKTAKKLAAKSSSTASSPGTPSSVIGREAFMSENVLVEAFSQQSRFYEETRDAVQGGRPPAGQHQYWRSTLASGYPPLVQIRTLYIEQLPSDTPDEQTVVETMLKADTERTLLMSESDLLQKAINIPETADQEHQEAERGAEAREELLVIEAEEKGAQEAFEAIPIEGVEPPLDVLNQAHEMLESIYNKLQQIEAESAEARALSHPFISFYNQTIVAVSHDRNFLNTVSQEIIHLRDHKIDYFPGNYDEYEMKLVDKIKMKDRISAALEKKRKHAQDTIKKQRFIMNKTGDDKRDAVIASRQKKLERLAGYNKTESGNRFMQSYIQGFHFNMGLLVMKEATEPSMVIPLPTPKELRGHPTTLLSLNNNVSLSLHHSSTIALVGPNGCGKSTLMSLLSGEVLPTSGSVEKFSSLVRIGYFSQHNVDQLDGEASKSAIQYLMDTFPDEYNSGPMARKYLGSFGIAGQTALLPLLTLSGGQKARVALAICVNGGPQVLLLDKIANHLDMATIQGLIVALKEFSGAVVLVSHDAYFVKAVCEDDNEDEDEEDDEDSMLRAQEGYGVVYRVKNGKLNRLEGGVDEYVKMVVVENKKGMRGGAGRPI
ncbi:hypothetical protein BGZ92_006205 [Podila epicladia]|nr:hypothetical protein BGZ92_006205 [Podila epicladia]